MSITHGIPIDIETEYTALLNQQSLEANTVLSAQQELGGLAPSDERLRYLPFAESYLSDTRKHHIARGLGELGLLAVQPGHVLAMNGRDQIAYSAAVLNYKELLDGRSGVYRTQGNSEAHWFIDEHAGADEAWSLHYGGELGSLAENLSATRLYATVKAIKEADRGAVHRAQKNQRHDKRADRVTVARKQNGLYVPIRQSKLAA